LIALLLYLFWAYKTERPESPQTELHKAEAEELSMLPKSVTWTVTAVVLGLLLLIGGSQVLLKGAVGIAVSFGIPETVIGLTWWQLVLLSRNYQYQL
jgi:cation:H+ antiporter